MAFAAPLAQVGAKSPQRRSTSCAPASIPSAHRPSPPARTGSPDRSRTPCREAASPGTRARCLAVQSLQSILQAGCRCAEALLQQRQVIMVHETHGSTASQCVAAFCPDERHAGGVDVDNASLAMHRDGLWQGLDQQPERREDDRKGTDGVLLGGIGHLPVRLQRWMATVT